MFAIAAVIAIVIVLAIAGIATQGLSSVVSVAQVVTAAVATLLAWRAVSTDAARIEVVAVDVRTLTQGYGGGLALLRVSMFNPASRGNVVCSMTAYRGTTDWPIDELVIETEDRIGGLTGTLKTQTIVYLGHEKIDVDLGVQASLPIGFQPYETKSVDVAFWTGRTDEDDSFLNGERIHVPHRERFLVYVSDGRGRRSGGRSRLYGDDDPWWRRAGRRLGETYERATNRQS